MAKLQLSFACGLYDRMQPLYTGEVTPDGIDLNFIAIDQPRPIFDRMSGGEEFDVSEYSLSEFSQRFTRKECPFVAIPVFPSIAFRHRLHRHQQEVRHQDAEGPRGQARRRAALYDDGGDLHQRHPASRIRRRSRQGPLGAGRHERGGVARQPDGAAAAQEDFDREQQDQQDARPVAGRGRDRRHARHQPAGGNPHQSEYRAVVSEFRRCRQGPLQAQEDLSDHALSSRSRRASTSAIRSWRRACTTRS